MSPAEKLMHDIAGSVARPPKIEPVYGSWLAMLMSKAVEDQLVDGHGPFGLVQYQGNSSCGIRMVFADRSNGQQYEVLVNVLEPEAKQIKKFLPVAKP